MEISPSPVKSFGKLCWDFAQWATGGLSLISGVLYSAFGGKDSPLGWTAIVALIVTTLVLWFKNYIHEQSLKPKLTLACRPDVAGCVMPNRWQGGSNLFFRIAVTSSCKSPVKNCQGRLISIKGPRILWQGDTATLTFAPSEKIDAEAKTIHPDVTVHLDVWMLLFGPADNFLGIHPGTKDRVWRFHPSLSDIFPLIAGDYVLTIQIVGDGMQTITRLLSFKWRGAMNSEMSLI